MILEFLVRIYTHQKLMWSLYVQMLVWYFKNQIRFQNLFLKMLLTAQKFMDSRLINLKWPILLNGHYKKLDYGTR